MQLMQHDFDKGRLALERFRKLIATRYLPLLRAVTKNDKLKVEPSAQVAATDGKTVWLPCPLALGDETLEHDKSLCGKREPSTFEMLCPLCKVEDEIDALVFHESAHITERSFEEVQGSQLWKDVFPVIEPYVLALDPVKAERLQQQIRKERNPKRAADILDPWLPYAWNCIEDIYVNRRLMKYRQGTELPLTLHTKDMFINGIPNFKSEERGRWEDHDASAQAIISVYLIGQGLPELGAYLDPAHDLTQDPTLVALVGEIPGDCPVRDRIQIAVKVVLHLRTLGYCPAKQDSLLPPPPPPPSTPPPEQEEDELSDPQSSSGESESSDGEGESDDESEESEAESNHGEEDDDEASTEGNGTQGEDGDDDPEEEDEAGGDSGESEPYDGDEAIEPEDTQDGGGSGQADPSDEEGEPSESSGDGEVEEEPYVPPTDDEVDEALERARKLLGEAMGHDEDKQESDLSNDRKAAEIVDTALKQESFDHPSINLTEGLRVRTKNDPEYRGATPKHTTIPRHLLTPSLARLRVVFASNRKTGVERSLKAGSRLDTMHLYRAGTDDPRIFGKRNIPKSRDWFVLVGIDMSGSTSGNGADAAQKMAAHAIGELLSILDIKFEMWAHTSAYATLEHTLIKGVDENWKDPAVQNMLFAQKGRQCNLDGHSMEQYRKVLERTRATDKMLLYFTDGAMPNANIQEELPILKENIELIRRMPKTHLVGVGFQTDSPKQHGLDTIRYNSPEDVASIVKGLEDRLLR
jgi:hypothetical protein